MPAQYFNKKRGTANGIVFAGGGLGGAVISFIMNGLLGKLGPAWTFRVLGFIAFATAMPAAWLIKERAPLTRKTLFEWYVPPPLVIELGLPHFPPGGSPKTFPHFKSKPDDPPSFLLYVL